MAKKSLIVAFILSAVAFEGRAEKECSKDSECSDGQLCCPSGLFEFCVAKSPIGGCP